MRQWMAHAQLPAFLELIAAVREGGFSWPA
jgi:hypothetical protein